MLSGAIVRTVCDHSVAVLGLEQKADQCRGSLHAFGEDRAVQGWPAGTVDSFERLVATLLVTVYGVLSRHSH